MRIKKKIFEFIKLDSIETRLSAIAVLFIMGTSVSMGCMGIWMTHKFVTQRFHDNFIVLSQYLARNAELGVLLKNRDMLKNLTTNMVQQEDIFKVIIKDSSERVIIETNKNFFLHKANNLDQQKYIKIETPILQIEPEGNDMELYDAHKNKTKEIIGCVELYYIPSGLKALTKEMVISFMAIALLLSFVSLAWYWFFARSITSPLINLVAASRKVSQGDFDVKPSGGGLRETKTLARVFNEMLNSVKIHQRETEKMHIEMAKQKSLAEIGKFSTMVAHELKNPIAIIKGSMDIFKKQDLDEKTRESMIFFVDDEIQRLNRLVDEFLLFAKPKKPIFSKISMVRFLEEIREKFGFTFPDKNIKISLSVEDSLVQCDGVLMERAVLNILKNSVEHSVPITISNNSKLKDNNASINNEDKSKYSSTEDSSAHDSYSRYDAYIEISGKIEEPAYYTIRIKDRGKGIDQSIIDDIFNPFFTTRAKGTGLGLAIVKDIISVHNGTVMVKNRPSGGALFEIKIMTYAVPSFFLNNYDFTVKTEKN